MKFSILSKFWVLPKRGLSFGQNGHESYWAELSPHKGQFAFAVSVVSSVIALRWNFFSCCGLLQVCCERFRFLRNLSHCMKFFNFVKVLRLSKKGSKLRSKWSWKLLSRVVTSWGAVCNCRFSLYLWWLFCSQSFPCLLPIASVLWKISFWVERDVWKFWILFKFWVLSKRAPSPRPKWWCRLFSVLKW